MNRNDPISIVAVIGLILVISCRHSGSGILEVKSTGKGIWLYEDKEPVMFFRSEPASWNGSFTRNNYVHPLYSVSGDTLTEDFPEDHRHHRGIFWAWHQVWVGEQRMGDPWLCKDFTWDIKDLETGIRTDAAIIKTLTHWKSSSWRDAKGNLLPLAEEQIKLTVFPAKRNSRTIFFNINLTSLTDSLKVGGSEDVKGYGGFSWRVKLPEDIVFTGKEGTVEPNTEAVHAGPWIRMHGSFSGKKQGGILVIAHPSNPGDPGKWILREKNSMQNAVYPGKIPVVLNMGEGFTLRYCLVIYEGDTDQLDPGEQYREYLHFKQNV